MTRDACIGIGHVGSFPTHRIVIGPGGATADPVGGGSRVAQSPGLLCMIPPSAKIVVAVT